jgi:hypothetical protein
MFAGHSPLPGDPEWITAFNAITILDLETKEVIYSPTELTQMR